MTVTRVGVFQTLQVIGTTVIIRDDLYGEHTVTEPVLVELLQSPELARLQGVCQHGVTSFFGHTPKVTRFEHSVGALLLVRKVGASVAEQVTALLHDISHTAFSHVMDYALSKPGEGSFHEVHKLRYLSTTSLPRIIADHGLETHKVFEEELFPLVEQPSPRLCADRLDYSLRDTVAFGKLDIQVAREVFSTLRAAPSVSSPDRVLVLDDPQLALKLARAYLAADEFAWSNLGHVDMYIEAGRLIREAVETGLIQEQWLWTMSDQALWDYLHQHGSPKMSRDMKALETRPLPSGEGLKLPPAYQDPNTGSRYLPRPAKAALAAVKGAFWLGFGAQAICG
ncbi:hypothetical protein N7468_000583 [Penicillium chermesinum]|uniref:HD/PDEase domain-containing protein n=1 Tax=Penicillium chermesinum TaxID=63820 RepID=A0A9W9PKJ5_9EURO|nr:uncharacterized protein N7468_000583 [Penicillium chermesinum]KAJ5249132.1 hypothetical protein N7468_000583 [Penicillium chermesinum]